MAIRRKMMISQGGNKNLLVPTSENVIAYSSYNHFSLNNGEVETTGTTLMAFKVKCEPSTQYTFDFDSTLASIGIRVISYTQEPTYITLQDNFIVNATGTTATFTTDANSSWIGCGFYTNKSGVTVSQFELKKG